MMKTPVTLLCVCFLAFSYILAASAVKDVYEYLWEKNKDMADRTLELDFLRQMENGSLQAERYIKFSIQDIGYLVKVTKILKRMTLKTNLPNDLRDFMTGRYYSYKRFADLMIREYFFKDEPTILLTPAMQKYVSTYRNLMENEEPLYFVVGLLPCSRLWVWLANNLQTPQNTPYYNWKVDNMDSRPEKHYKDLLNKHLNTPEKVAKANAIFREQMQNEHDFFSSS